MKMEVCFKGAAKEVGRSAILVKTAKAKVMFDYGLKPLPKGVDFPEKVNDKIDALFISHGHLDHLGAAPLLKDIPVYAHEITSHFTRLLLTDTLKIAKQDGYELGYGEEDVKSLQRNFQFMEYDETVSINGEKIKAIDAGHMPGSFMFFMKDQSLLYTGDFKLEDTRLVKGANPDIGQVKTLVMETTYSDRDHPDREKEEKRLMDFIKQTLDNDGVMLMPTFAISRTQELILVLNEYGIKTPIYIDGMSASATEIINAYPELQKEYNSVKKAMQRLDVRYVDAPNRKKIIKKPCIVITGSGMLEGGAILEYMKRLHDNENCSVALTGFQVPGTAGFKLLQTGQMSINGKDVKVKATVKKFDFSSHASRTDILELIDKLNPENIFCVHGEKTEEFADELKNKGYNAYSPERKCYKINL
ncbi:MAG: MBL fold metallo-hydrolase [Candidatus Aenigmarchaeota archaeon]|nr:MBL fold metallo-hydrolase [Candidatus Aenigmarchaeota archaeon]